MELLTILGSIAKQNLIGLEIMIVFIVVDVLTGLIKAVIEKDLQSGLMRSGVLKKLLEIILVLVAGLIDVLMNTEFLAKAVITFIVAMEGLSVLENIGTYIPLPEVLKTVLESLKDQGNKGGE